MVADIETLFVGRTLIELKITDSTNAFAQELISSGSPVEGTIVFAHQQVAGKGQRGATWESEAHKNFTFSLILKPSFLNLSGAFQLSKCIALGIADYLMHQLGEGIKIKWPNDIYFLDKKIGGILIENTVRGQHLKFSVAGIGLNINQTEFSHAPAASSMKIISENSYNLPDEFSLLCKAVEKRYLQLKSGLNKQLDFDYISMLYGYREIKKYLYQKTCFEARITGITPEGKLVLTDTKGHITAYDLKEIQLVLESKD